MSADSTRRAFLSGALAAAGAAVARPAVAATGQTRPAIDRDRKVELAIATICLDGFGDENFEPTFRLIPDVGVRNVEFNVWFPRNLTPAGIESIGERCRTRGLTPICLQGTAFGGNVVKDVTHKLWLMEQARRLGCRRVKFTGARRGTDGGLDNVISTLRELAPAAEAMDVLVLVENHANNNIETIEDYDRIFEAIDSTHVGMCLDMGHFDGAGVSNFDVIGRFHRKVLHIDMKDTVAFGTYRTVNYGSGVTDVAGIVERMIGHGYAGYLLIEQAPPLNPTTLVADMRRARGLFEKYAR
jgi:sugar phosphate isomerase/epimerase